MKNKGSKRKGVSKKTILIAIGLGLAFWTLQSAIHVFEYQEGSFIEEMFTLNPNKIWLRSLVFCILIMFGAYAQGVITERKQAEEDLRRMRDELEIWIQKRTAGLSRTNEVLCEEITEHKRAEQKLKESEQRFKTIFESATDGILVSDMENKKFFTGNKMICKMLGYSLEKLKSLGVMDIHSKEDQPYVIEQFKRQQKGEITLAENIPVKKKDGTIFYADVNSAPITLAGKTCQMGIFRDVTERKRIEEALQKRTYDLDGRVKELNCLYGISNLRERKNISLEELLQGTVDLVPPSWQYPEITCARVILKDQVFKTNNFKETIWKQWCDIFVYDQKAGTLEVRYLKERPDSYEGPFLKEERNLIGAIAKLLGEIIEHKRAEEELRRYRDHLEELVENRTAELTIANQKLKREIVERKRVEEKIKQVAEEWEATFDGITDLVSIHDKDFKIVRVNKAFADVFKMKPEQFIGETCYKLVHGTKEPPPYCPLTAVAHSGRTITVESAELFPGTGSHHEVTSSPILDEKGKTDGIVHIVKDITGRKLTEKALAERTLQLEQTNKELERNNIELDQFTYIASHDLQEPLRKVMVFSDILRKDLDDDLPEQAEKDFGFITDAARRMQKLVQDLLALSRSGRATLKCEKISLDNCVNQAIEALAIRIKETGAEISRDELPQVWGDQTMLIQLYQNLISNALKFTTSTHPVVRLTAERVNGHLALGVKDNGIGIKPEYAEQIFAPFKRLHGRGEYEGTGIGLAICRKTVERHGGKIWVESKPGEGTHFKFTISEKTPNTKEESSWENSMENLQSSSSLKMIPTIKS